MTYVWCGSDMWCYLFNVIDVFTGEWLGCALDTTATRHNAVIPVNNAIASSHVLQVLSYVLITDQYVSSDFQKSIRILGAGLEFITAHRSRTAT